MEVIDIFSVLRRHVFLIAVLFIVTTVAGYGLSFVSSLIPERYDASAVLLVRPHQPIKITGSPPNREFADFPVGNTPVVEVASKTYIEIIKSPTLVGEVVRKLHLDKKKKAPVCGSIFGQINDCVKALFHSLGNYAKDTWTILKYGRLLKDDPFEKAVKDVTKNLTLKSYEDTYAFEIKFSGEDRKTAADVANTIAKLFIQFMSQMQSSEAKASADRLRNELKQSWQRLTNARERLQSYEESHGVFQTKSEYDAKLKVIGDLTVELAKLDANLAKLDETADAHSERGSSAADPPDNNPNAMKRARLRKILAEKKAELASLPKIEHGLQLRQSDVDVANTTYETVAKALNDAEIKINALPEARMISPAVPPDLPSHPRHEYYLLISALTGLLVGVALAFFLEYINRTARRIEDIESFLDLKVIGTIPLARFRHRDRDFAYLAPGALVSHRKLEHSE